MNRTHVVTTVTADQPEPVPPHHGDARARVLREVAARVGQLRTQAALHPDAYVDCALTRETIALLQSLLPVDATADKRAQLDMANEHHARADRAELSSDLESLRFALFTGQKSQAKFEAQEAFLRIAKRITDIDLLNEWIVQPSERGAHRGLMYRVWDTGRGDIVVDLFNDQDPHPSYKFQRRTATEALGAAALAITEGKVLT